MQPELDNLDERLRGFYQRQSIAPATVDRLKRKLNAAATTTVAAGESVTASLSRLRRPVLIAAVFSTIAAVAALVLLVFWLSITRPDERVAHLAAQEVALNHHKQLAVEYPAATIDQLAGAMSKLDFTPVMPQRFRDNDHRVIGARYCSLRGQIAAQIRLTDTSGRTCTLYEARPMNELAEVAAAEFEIDGCRIEVWREAGLLMVLAGPAHQ
jgi:hypothetical protein